MKSDKHISVMKDEAIKWLDPQSGQNFIDCTLGRGGHTLDILKSVLPKGKVLAIDLDNDAIKHVKSKVSNSDLDNLILIKDNFKNLKKIYDESFADVPVNGVLLDLGVSSPQLDNLERGFSFKGDNLLDMNFDQDSKFKAVDIVNSWDSKRLEKIFTEYGEEKYARKIANKIIERRKEEKIISTKQLAQIVKNCIPAKFQGNIHPATKVFQALRIAVNDELNNLREVLPQIVELLSVGGKVAVISFHSLEDRIVKQFFVEQSRNCICPPSFPICQCNNKAKLKILTKKPITASEEEIEHNPRSRSAKLRVAQKI